MKFFDELGAMVAAQWKQRDYNERQFPQAAMTALAHLPPSRNTGFEGKRTARQHVERTAGNEGASIRRAAGDTAR